MDMSALGGSGLSVVVRGRDLDKLQELAKQAAADVTEVEGTVEVSDGIEETTPEYRFVVDREKAAAKGLTTCLLYTSRCSRPGAGGRAIFCKRLLRLP